MSTSTVVSTRVDGNKGMNSLLFDTSMCHSVCACPLKVPFLSLCSYSCPSFSLSSSLSSFLPLFWNGVVTKQSELASLDTWIFTASDRRPIERATILSSYFYTVKDGAASYQTLTSGLQGVFCVDCHANLLLLYFKQNFKKLQRMHFQGDLQSITSDVKCRWWEF